MNELLLIDGNSLVTTSYYATKASDLRSPDGTPTGAVRVFINTFFAVDDFSTHVAVAFDKCARLLRNDIYPEYKANREPMPEDLAVQYPLVQQFLKYLKIPMFAIDGYEGDDIIVSLAAKFSPEISVRIATHDRDLIQACKYSNVSVDLLRHQGGTLRVIKESADAIFGVPADKIALFKALAGDSSDNVPGIRGIGPIAARELVAEYDNIDDICEAIDSDNISKKYRNKLNGRSTELRNYYAITTFMTNDVTISLRDLERQPPDESGLTAFYVRLGINL